MVNRISNLVESKNTNATPTKPTSRGTESSNTLLEPIDFNNYKTTNNLEKFTPTPKKPSSATASYSTTSAFLR